MDFRMPISVKAVITKGDEVILLKNERDEWELPSGRLEPGETPESCLTREVREELRVDITIDALLDAWVYHVAGKDVLILVYDGPLVGESHDFVISDEHQEVGLFKAAELDLLPLPAGYRSSIAKLGIEPRIG